MTKKRAIIITAAAVLILALGSVWFFTRPKATTKVGGQSYELTTISKGTIESTVSSSGTLAPVSEVSVLAQMSGRVEKVNATYNDKVKKGQVLVELNTDTLKLQELEADSAVKKAQANYNLQNLDYQNKTELAKKGLLADYDLKSSKTNLDVYAAELASAESALKVIQIQLNQYALITSPITGIVLDMDVEVGQSVVEGSSSNASSLFTLAEDLAKMQIKATVDELDISSIKTGQEVRFTVEADPKTKFTGTVKEIRLVPTTTNNVVNYYVIIDADNRNGKLLPGMTADIQFIKEKKTDVFVVPSAALRFTPTTLTAAEIAKAQYLAGLAGLTAEQKAQAEQAYDEQVKTASANKTATKTTGLTSLISGSSGMGGPGGGPGGRPGEQSSAKTATTTASVEVVKYLWYVGTDGKLAALKVTVGTSDSTNTEVSSTEDLTDKKVVLKIKVE
jgi:HlyD family secretion protein